MNTKNVQTDVAPSATERGLNKVSTQLNWIGGITTVCSGVAFGLLLYGQVIHPIASLAAIPTNIVDIGWVTVFLLMCLGVYLLTLASKTEARAREVEHQDRKLKLYYLSQKSARDLLAAMKNPASDVDWFELDRKAYDRRNLAGQYHDRTKRDVDAWKELLEIFTCIRELIALGNLDRDALKASPNLAKVEADLDKFPLTIDKWD